MTSKHDCTIFFFFDNYSKKRDLHEECCKREENHTRSYKVKVYKSVCVCVCYKIENNKRCKVQLCLEIISFGEEGGHSGGIRRSSRTQMERIQLRANATGSNGSGVFVEVFGTQCTRKRERERQGEAQLETIGA